MGAAIISWGEVTQAAPREPAEVSTVRGPQRIHVATCYTLGLKEVPMSLLWGLCMYYVTILYMYLDPLGYISMEERIALKQVHEATSIYLQRLLLWALVLRPFDSGGSVL